jgi:polygalacturonase
MANEPERKSRREALKTGLAAAAFLAGGSIVRGGARLPGSEPHGGAAARSPWDELPKILRTIKAPRFRDHAVYVNNFGAVGDNKTDSTEAFQKAIDACSQAGGGRVVVPKGEFSTGAIVLKSKVNLNLDQGATIRFSRDTSKYPVVYTRYEGTELMNYSPFIYAFEQENIAITGQGTIDGNADCQNWWNWVGGVRCGAQGSSREAFSKDRNALHDMAENGVPVNQRVFGPGHYLRPQFIQPFRCKNVLIEGVTLLNSPMWQVTPALCTNVTVRGLSIHSDGPNTDGCDPDSSSYVLIENCSFQTGDDCIAIKSGRNADGRRLHTPSENIVIQGCHMKDGHGGVTIGSEDSGGVRNVFAQNCEMDSPNLDIAIRVKNNAARGGDVEGLYVRNIKVGQVATAGVSIDFYYEEGEAGKYTPVTRNVDIRSLTLEKAKYALYLRGFKNAPIEDVHLTDCTFDGVATPNVVENVRDLSLSNVRINGKPADQSS